jgi:pyruvate dehydrogenase E1 component beta subunit
MLYAERGLVPSDPNFLVPFGEARIVRSGAHITVVAIGGMLRHALRAAEQLAADGLELEVIDPRTLVPFDLETVVRSLEKTGRLIIAHEAHKRCGPGAEIAALIAEEALDWLDAPIVRVAAKNVPIPYAPPLEQFVLPSAEDIVMAAQKLALPLQSR